MFHHSTYYTLQTETIMAHQSAQYSISDSENQRIATFEEDSSTSGHWLNHALKLFNLDQMASLHIKLLSPKQEVIAHIHRKKGLSSDVSIQTAGSTFDLHFKGSVSQKIIAESAGETLFEVDGKNMASDFEVKTGERQIATIQKRSIPAPTTKEAWLSGDLYHVRGHEWTEEQVILILCTALMIDLTYHHK
ncbi:hypothetical protein DXT76_20170 [Halobacillus trueperi]|uniref:Uncharacterized protein n=1 Tax=Halobacillus trueperi TaxID=156205 RepID=A0A3D8VC05_9BACI|nr:hypothetical protein [Halobacillus trueperi]RDY66970.1 hypothetical protein DXT76_20170 [Halobacillus trueperi]